MTQQITRVIAYLQEGGATAQEVADETGVPIRNVKTYMNEMKRDGLAKFTKAEPTGPCRRKPYLWTLVR